MSTKTGAVRRAGVAPSRTTPARRIRKNMDMDPQKLAEARRILGARTETETVDQALDLVIFQGRVASALDRLAAAGGIEDINEVPADAPSPAAERKNNRRRGKSR